MIFCSFIVEAPDVLSIPGYAIVLDRGRNVFSAYVPDVDVFREVLTGIGCNLVQVNRLDDFDPLTPQLLDP
jgi:hypothetical protein